MFTCEQLLYLFVFYNKTGFTPTLFRPLAGMAAKAERTRDDARAARGASARRGQGRGGMLHVEHPTRRCGTTPAWPVHPGLAALCSHVNIAAIRLIDGQEPAVPLPEKWGRGAPRGSACPFAPPVRSLRLFPSADSCTGIESPCGSPGSCCQRREVVSTGLKLWFFPVPGSSSRSALETGGAGP